MHIFQVNGPTYNKLQVCKRIVKRTSARIGSILVRVVFNLVKSHPCIGSKELCLCTVKLPDNDLQILLMKGNLAAIIMPLLSVRRGISNTPNKATAVLIFILGSCGKVAKSFCGRLSCLVFCGIETHCVEGKVRVSSSINIVI